MRKRAQKTSAVSQLNNDLGVSKLSFVCEKCGGVLSVDPNHIQSFCQFCGAPLPKAEDLIKLSYEYMEKNKDREMELKRMEHQTKVQKIKTVYDMMELGFFVLLIAFVVGILIWVNNL